MTVIVGILALIGLAVVGAIGWAFVHGVRDGLARWREVPPGGASQPVPVGEPPLSLSAALPSSYQAGQLAGEVAASWRSAHQTARAAAGGGRDVSNGGSGASSGGGVTDESSGNSASGGGVSPETVPDASDSNRTAEGMARPTWLAHAPSRRPPQPRPRRCTQLRPARSDERRA